MLAEVLTHDLRTPDVAVITCRPRRRLPFRAGQQVPVECAYVPWQSRPFAIANAPRADGVLEFHVRSAGCDGVRGALVNRVKAGDLLDVGAPSGLLRLDPYSRRDIVFVTGGTGLAPAKALIDEVSRYNRTRWIHLFRGERRRGGFYDRVPVDRLALRHPWLNVVRATSDEPDEHGVQALISDVVVQHGPWPDHDFYVCGSSAMVAATVRRLDECGVPAGRVQCHTVAAPACLSGAE